MRLEPVERPGNVILRMIYWMVYRRFGKVVTPLKILYARKPKLLSVFLLIDRLLNKNVTLSPSFRLLFQTQVSLLNGCGFCQDVLQAVAVQRCIGMEKFHALRDYKVSPLFDERERAALAFAEDFSRNKHVSDATFEGLRKHFSETEIVELIWMNAVENYFNSLVIPLKINPDSLAALTAKRMERKAMKRFFNPFFGRQ